MASGQWGVDQSSLLTAWTLTTSLAWIRAGFWQRGPWLHRWRGSEQGFDSVDPDYIAGVDQSRVLTAWTLTTLVAWIRAGFWQRGPWLHCWRGSEQGFDSVDKVHLVTDFLLNVHHDSLHAPQISLYPAKQDQLSTTLNHRIKDGFVRRVRPYVLSDWLPRDQGIANRLRNVQHVKVHGVWWFGFGLDRLLSWATFILRTLVMWVSMVTFWPKTSVPYLIFVEFERF